MYSKILILRFPNTEVEKPIVCYLAKDYDLTFNILNAAVLPRKEGVMVLELSGSRKNFREGVKYLKSHASKCRMRARKFDGTITNAPTAAPALRSAPPPPSWCKDRR